MVRRGSHLNLTVDKHTETLRIPAEFSRRDVVEVGAPPATPPPNGAPQTAVSRFFPAERRIVPGTREELSRLPGEPRLQRPQPDRAGQTPGSPGLRRGE